MREANLLYEYTHFNKMLADRSFPLENIAFLMFVELIKWQANQGRALKQSEVVKRFSKVGYRLYHSKWLRYMKGIGGDMINFVVPGKRTLLKNLLVLCRV